MGSRISGFFRTLFKAPALAAIAVAMTASAASAETLLMPTPVSYTHLTLPTSDLV